MSEAHTNTTLFRNYLIRAVTPAEAGVHLSATLTGNGDIRYLIYRIFLRAFSNNLPLTQAEEWIPTFA